MILIVASFVYAGLFALTAFGGMGGEFFPVLGNIVLFLAMLAVLVATPLLLILKKEELAKWVFTAVAVIWAADTIREFISASGYV